MLLTKEPGLGTKRGGGALKQRSYQLEYANHRNIGVVSQRRIECHDCMSARTPVGRKAAQDERTNWVQTTCESCGFVCSNRLSLDKTADNGQGGGVLG